MTIPSERARAILKLINLARALLDPKKTPRVPKRIRQQAYWALRHAPWSGDIQSLSEKAPEILNLSESDLKQFNEGHDV